MRSRTTMRRTLALLAVVAGCGSEKPAEYPPSNTEVKTVDPAPRNPAPAETTASTAPPEEEVHDDDPAFADAPVRPLGREEIHILVKSLPLSLDAVRFDAIDKFLLLYAPFTANKALLRETRKAFRVAKACLQVPVSAISLSSRPAELAGLLKQPYPGRYFYPFAQALLDGVSRTKDVILDFNEQVRDQVQGEEAAHIWGQIGKRPDDNTIASRNIEYITAWLRTPHN
jgi:hypothetical protein